MPRLTIDQRPVDVPPGNSVLDAARTLGIDIPTLCHRDGYPPNTTCMLCVVKVKASDGPTGSRMVPACATAVTEGMVIESETPEIHALRRNALELLLSDHAGECRAPCQYACPFDMDVPGFMRAVAENDLATAVRLLRTEVPLAAALPRISRDPCEGGCRRGHVDQPPAIGELKRVVAERDLHQEASFLPDCPASTGKRVAIIGSGPAGLSLAWFLLQRGHACSLYERSATAGGSLRARVPNPLPADILDEEIQLIRRLGATFELSTNVVLDAPESAASGTGTNEPSSRHRLSRLRATYDAVALACGHTSLEGVSLPPDFAIDGRVVCDAQTFACAVPGLFAIGTVMRPKRDALRAAADAKRAAYCVDQFLRGELPRALEKLNAPAAVRPTHEELRVLATAHDQHGDQPTPIARSPGENELALDDLRQTAGRCLHCDCHKLSDCRLRRYAEQYGADARRYRGERRAYVPARRAGGVRYEPGKCILCGLCVQITAAAGEPLGLAYVGRGFEVRIDVPFGAPLRDALQRVARQCVAACPTGALAFEDENIASQSPPAHCHGCPPDHDSGTTASSCDDCPSRDGACDSNA